MLTLGDGDMRGQCNILYFSVCLRFKYHLVLRSNTISVGKLRLQWRSAKPNPCPSIQGGPSACPVGFFYPSGPVGSCGTDWVGEGFARARRPLGVHASGSLEGLVKPGLLFLAPTTVFGSGGLSSDEVQYFAFPTSSRVMLLLILGPHMEKG